MGLSRERILELLKCTIVGKTLYYFEEIDSTNRVAWELASQGEQEGSVVIADRQSRGRGRKGRMWLSPAGVNLYMSVVLRPPIRAEEIPTLSILGGVAVADCLNNFFPEKVTLKWPNDVLLSGKKVSGILCEARTSEKKVEFVVLGIGLNINLKVASLPEELKEKTTSMREEKGNSFSRPEVVADLLYHLEGDYLLFLNYGFSVIKNRWLFFSPLQTKISVNTGEKIISGIFKEMDDLGGLVVTDEEGKTHRLLAGDVII